MSSIIDEKKELVIPSNVKSEKIGNNISKFVISPLEHGFGITIGNALRRVLLSRIKGHAIYAIEIEGVKHEFSTIDGVLEDVIEIVSNLKNLYFKNLDNGVTGEVIELNLDRDSFKGSDINKVSKSYKVVNEDLVICHFSKDVNFKIKLYVNTGYGFCVAKEFDKEKDKIGKIYIDSIYSPVVNVAFSTEDVRIKDVIDYDSLTITVETNGTITPEEAIKEGAELLIDHFILFTSKKKFVRETDEEPEVIIDIKTMKLKELLNKPLKSFNFNRRPLNCFEAAGIKYVKDLVKMSEAQLRAIKSLGAKTVNEIQEFMANNNLSFEMDIKKYEL